MLRTLLRTLGFSLAAAYGIYTLGLIVLLNTPLFSHLVDMVDTDHTYLRFDRAWSIVPGTIHARTARLRVREPDVDLDVDLHHVRIHFGFRGLFRREVRMALIHADETSVDIREKIAPASEVLPPGAVAIEEKRRLAERWTIVAERVDLPRLSRVGYESNLLLGEMSVAGSFFLQPGTRCEIYPSTFRIADGNWNDEVVKINLEAQVRFHRFEKMHVAGSEVIRFIDARIEGGGVAKTFRTGAFLYTSPSAPLTTRIEVLAGKPLPGSFATLAESPFRIGIPSLELTGTGNVEWKVDPSSNATLLGRIQGHVDGKYPYDISWNAPDFSPSHGRAKVDVRSFSGLLDYLRDSKRITAVQRRGLGATRVRALVAWDKTDTGTRIRLREIDSNGIWSAAGTVTATEKKSGDGEKFRGRFDAKILGIPFQVSLAP
jgi:hypothetical protein